MNRRRYSPRDVTAPAHSRRRQHSRGHRAHDLPRSARSAHARTPEELANDLAFFQIDLSDPDFRRLTLEHSRRVRAGYRRLLEEAIACGDLRPCDPSALASALASALQAVSGGSLLNWAVHRDGPATAWVRADLETLIAPYRQSPRRGHSRRPGPSGTSRAR